MDEKMCDSEEVAMDVDNDQVVMDEDDSSPITPSEKSADSKVQEANVTTEQAGHDLKKDADDAEFEVEKSKSSRPSKKAKSETGEGDSNSDATKSVSETASTAADPISDGTKLGLETESKPTVADQISDGTNLGLETEAGSMEADPISDGTKLVPETESKSTIADQISDGTNSGHESELESSKADKISVVKNSIQEEVKTDSSVPDPINDVTKSEPEEANPKSEPSDSNQEVAESKFSKTDAKEISDSKTSGKLSDHSHLEGTLLESHHEVVKRLRKLGYDFNKNGELRQFDQAQNKLTDKKFEFVVKKGDQDSNQKNYEKLGEVIDEYVYCLLETIGGLKKVLLGKGSFIFVSDDWKSNRNKLMVLIHGSGVVRAGQWARRLIINNNIHVGTQLPYIEKAKKAGYSVIVLNTNDNKRKAKEIEGSETPIKHAISAWKQYISMSPATKIAIVAHSYGGVVTVNLAQNFLQEFKKRVFSIMFTDSVHSLEKNASDVAKFLEKTALNYIAAREPLGTEIPYKYEAVPMVSAGHETHEWTSASAFEDIFKRLEKKLAERQ